MSVWGTMRTERQLKNESRVHRCAICDAELESPGEIRTSICDKCDIESTEEER